MAHFLLTLLQTGLDILPITLVIVAFQAGVLRRRPRHLRRILLGLFYTLIGLTLFRLGLEDLLIPLGGEMARRMTAAGDTLWLYAFAASLGFAAAMIEPTLWAVAQRAEILSGGELHAAAIRLAVAVGVSAGLLLGTIRVVTGLPLLAFLLPLLLGVGLLALSAPRSLVPLALDSGALATSVVTVPLVAAFGIAVAATLPGRDPVKDGFGLVFFSLLMPSFSLLALNRILRLWRVLVS